MGTFDAFFQCFCGLKGVYWSNGKLIMHDGSITNENVISTVPNNWRKLLKIWCSDGICSP